jgi:plastocyanin
MRPQRLLLPLTLALALGSASPAMAADVTIPDFLFSPDDLEIAVGETVTWRFNDDVRHSTKSKPGQAESWNSGLKAAGETFTRTFTKPGRLNYICEPHPFMQASVTVGEDEVGDTVDRLRDKRRGDDSVKITYELNEAAKVTYKLKGPSPRSVKRKREKAGRHSFRLKNLKPGKYRGTLTLVDDYDKKATAKNSFRVP